MYMRKKSFSDWFIKLIILIFISILSINLVANARTTQPHSTNDSTQFYTKSYALVIGVNTPQGEWAPLSSAQDDAQMFAHHLKKRGFDVTLLLGAEANKQEILKQLQTQFPNKVKSEDRFVFYFAGHGQTQTLGQGSKLGYIVPADGNKNASQDEWHTYLSMRELRSLLTEHILSKHTLLIFDSCFSGLMFTRGGLRRPSLDARSYLKRNGVMAITAGGEGELALDGLFTPTFIQALSGEADENSDGITSFQELALYTRREVRSKQEQQNPQFGVISGTGQMIFTSQNHLNQFSIKTQQPSASLARPTEQTSTHALADHMNSENLLDPSAFNRKLLWSSTAITSGLLSLAGAGLLAYARDQFNELNRELVLEPDDDIYNNRLNTEGKDIITKNNTAIILLAVGGSGLLLSVYKLLNMTHHPMKMTKKTNSSSVAFVPDPLNRAVGLEITW